MRKSAAGSPDRPSRRRLAAGDWWRLAIIVAAAGTCALLEVGRRGEGQGLGSSIFLVLVVIVLLSVALYEVHAVVGASNPARVWAAAMVIGLMAGGFAVAFGTLAPGRPIVSLVAEAAGASVAVGPESAGQPAVLRVHGNIEREAKGNVDFVVEIGDVAVDGRLARVKRRLRVGRRRATSDGVPAFHHRLALPDRTRDLRVTRLMGPLDGPLHVELLPHPVPPWAGLALAATGIAVALILERRLRSNMYAPLLGIGLGALASVAGWARPAAELQEVAVLMVAGGVIGGVLSGLSAHLLSRVWTRKGVSE